MWFSRAHFLQAWVRYKGTLVRYKRTLRADEAASGSGNHFLGAWVRYKRTLVSDDTAAGSQDFNCWGPGSAYLRTCEDLRPIQSNHFLNFCGRQQRI